MFITLAGAVVGAVRTQARLMVPVVTVVAVTGRAVPRCLATPTQAVAVAVVMPVSLAVRVS